MADKSTSSAQSLMDQITGAAQAAIGAVTGNTADQVRFAKDLQELPAHSVADDGINTSMLVRPRRIRPLSRKRPRTPLPRLVA